MSDEKTESLKIIDEIGRKATSVNPAHLKFYLGAILKRANVIAGRISGMSFDEFAGDDVLVDSIGMKIIQIGQIAFEAEIVFPHEKFWADKLGPDGRRVNPDGMIPFGELSYTNLKTMRNIDAHCWELDPKSVYADALSMKILIETIDYVLRESIGLSEREMDEVIRHEPDEFQRIVAIIDSRSDIGNLFKLTVYERHEKLDRFSCIREIEKMKYQLVKNIFCKIAFARDFTLCERLFRHYDALGEFDEFRKKRKKAKAVSPKM